MHCAKPSRRSLRPSTGRTAASGQGVQLPVVTVVDGGPSRAESVRAAMAALLPGTEAVLVHDAARALAPESVFHRVFAGPWRRGRRRHPGDTGGGHRQDRGADHRRRRRGRPGTGHRNRAPGNAARRADPAGIRPCHPPTRPRGGRRVRRRPGRRRHGRRDARGTARRPRPRRARRQPVAEDHHARWT